MKIELIVVPSGGGRRYSMELPKAPAGAAWQLTTELPLPKGKYEVSAMITVKKDGKELSYTSKLYKDIDVNNGLGLKEAGYVNWDANRLRIDQGAKTNSLSGDANITAPKGYKVETVYAVITLADGGGGVGLLPMVERPPADAESALRKYAIGKKNPDPLKGYDPAQMPKDPVGTKYRVNVVAVFKSESTGITRQWWSPATEVEIKNR